MTAKVFLSPSAVGLYKDCPRCFWIDKNLEKPRPRGVFPSLPGGMDRILKDHYDVFRAAGALPQELAGQVEGKLYPDKVQLDRWRNWRTGLKAETNVAVCGGALDDLLVTPKGLYSPFDFKTRGSAPKEGGSEQYYGHQLDIYAFMLNANGMPASGSAHLAYYHPADVGKENQAGLAQVRFHCTVVTLTASPERAAQLINAAADCVRGPMPPPSPKCEFCLFETSRRGLEDPAGKAASA